MNLSKLIPSLFCLPFLGIGLSGQTITEDLAQPGGRSLYCAEAQVWTFPANVTQGSEAERTVFFQQATSMTFMLPLQGNTHPLAIRYSGLTEVNQARVMQLSVNRQAIGKPITLKSQLTEHVIRIPASVPLTDPLEVTINKVKGQNVVAHSIAIENGQKERERIEEIGELPDTFRLLHFDDAGVAERQPHIFGGKTYTFSEGHAPHAEDRSVAFDPTGFSLRYEDLYSDQDYILVLNITADDAPRRQSIRIQDTFVMRNAAPSAGSQTQHLYRVPGSAIKNGTLEVLFEKTSGHNAVLASAALWTDGDKGEATAAPSIGHINRLDGLLIAMRFDASYRPVKNFSVRVTSNDGTLLTEKKSDHTGSITVERDTLTHLATSESIQITAPNMPVTQIPLSDIRAPEFTFPEVPDSVEGLEQPTLSLDGEWQLHQPAPASPQSFDLGSAQPAKIPGQWQQQGFTENEDESVMVQRSFKLPNDWNGRRIRLRFDSIHGNCTYWLNGRELGGSTRLYTPIDFDITEYVTAGSQNTLTIHMELGSAAETLSHTSEYAKHSLLGIDRSVFVYALPEVSIDSLHLQSEHNGDYSEASLNASVALTSSNPESTILDLRLIDPDGQQVALPQSSFELSALEKEGDRYQLSLPVPNPQLWNAETPHLYTLHLRAKAHGNELARWSKKVGLRELRIDGSRLLVNGQAIKLRGINRHEIHPLTGRADTMKWARMDAQLFKDASINYVRTSHYPPPREFMEACDEIGIYVQVEAPFCWTRGKGEADPALLPVWADASAAMMEYHRNHTSNIMWSLANESNPAPHKSGFRGLKSNYEQLAHWYKAADRGRPGTINNEWNNNGGLTDIANIHYPAPTFEANPDLAGETRPVLIDEHWHMNCYNIEELLHDPGVAEEWAEMKLSFGRSFPQDPWSDASWINRMEKSELFLGGAIWGGIDEVFVLEGEEVGYGAWGIIDGWRRKKPEWWHTRMIHSSVWIPQKTAKFSSGTAEFSVENRTHFTQLDALQLSVRVNGEELTETPPAIAPGESGTVRIQLPNTAKEGDLMVLDFVNSQGKPIATWGLHLNKEPEPLPLFTADSGAPAIDETADGWSIETKGQTYTIDRESGRLSGGPFRDRPRPHFTQKEFKNWFVPQAPAYLQLPDPDSNRIESVTVEARDEIALITILEDYGEFSGRIEIEIDKEDTFVLRSDYTYTGEKARTIRELGIRLSLQEGYETVDWSRRGYWNVYPEGHLGRLEGSAKAKNPETEQLAMSKKFHIAIEQPTEDWTQDPSDFGTRDFRASKLNFDEASIRSEGTSIHFRGAFERHIRPALSPDGVDVFINMNDPETTMEPNKTQAASLSMRIQ